ncbi:DUF1963 domain-containing protein [Flavivirga algicola]|uniref:DUF1963 domain-containing protein n=1 Tax=Flavivirga algicola TaxID=2729136 RepID=A0ABX1RZ50_9FLAO|nr:DUF1963 domain-containing protein [Flavivirga algicola]NMH88859.1 DUF1963 domain-containing protein [Flavivirga algicola]
MNSKKRIIEEVKRYEWDNVEDVIKSIIPNILFSVNESESKPNLLSSRFGGRPAVPDNFSWPLQSKSENAPLAFFFQLNFEEIKPFDVDNVLPDHGILLCFASVTNDIMWEHEIPDAFKVYYFPGIDSLSFADIPEDIPSEQQLAPRTITYRGSFQLPSYPFNYISNGLSEDDADGIDEVANTMFDEAYNTTMRIEMAKSIGLAPPVPKDDFHTLFSHNLILGVPISVQHTVAEVWSEMYCGEDYKESENYVNLISFEMKNREGYGFSDNGAHLYLCIHKKDLKNKEFEKTIFIVQNT